MKHILKYIIFFPLVIFLMASCYEDKGNYDYKDIKDADITIPGVTDQKDQVRLDRYEKLNLNPEIKFNAGGSATEFNFEWKLFPQSPVRDENDVYPEAKVIGTTQNLSYELVDAPDKYYVVLNVENKETKAVSEYRFKLDVMSITGWLVYDETAANSGDFQIIRDAEIVPGLAASHKGIVRDYYSYNNNGEKLATGKFLSRRTHSSYDHLYLFSDNGVVKMGAGTYEEVTKNYADLFLNPPAISAPQAHFYANPAPRMVELLINNGVIYPNYYGGMVVNEQYTNPLSTGMMTYFAEPFIAGIPPVSSYTNTAVFYNSRGKGSFLVVNKFGNPSFPGTPSGLFNVGQINPDVTISDLKIQALEQGQNGVTCAIFKDVVQEDHLWLYQADFRAAQPIAMARIDINALEDIKQAKLFAFGTRGDVMFYAAGSKVYSYVFNGTNVTTLLSKPGEEIVSMKLYTHSANEDYSGRMLFVATNSGSTGKVYKIKFNELNGQLDGDIEEFTGFGRIIDMMCKE